MIEGDNGYVSRVLAEQLNLRSVADGKGVAINAPIVLPPVKEAAATPVEVPNVQPVPAETAPPAKQVASLRP